MRLYLDAERIFLFIVAKTAPGGGVLGENDGPLVGCRNHVKAVSPCRKSLAFDGYIFGKSNRCVLVCPRAPDFVIGNGSGPPNLPAADQRRVIVDCDIGEPDALSDHGMLADRRNVQFRGLSAVLELCRS